MTTIAKGTFEVKLTPVPMTEGAGAATLARQPDTGTDDLIGLGGTLKIIIEGGKHSYELEYTPAWPAPRVENR